jgi:DNA-binding transcriptional LysR family regulator
VDSSDAVAAIVLSGGGIGISPTYIAAPLVERGELIPILKEFVTHRFDIIAFWPESRRGNPGVKAFVSFLSESISDPTAWDMIYDRAEPYHRAASDR